MQFDQLTRREFMSLIGGAAAAWPLAVRAQPSNMPTVGFVYRESAKAFGHVTAAFRRCLAEPPTSRSSSVWSRA
jgi:putative ABC transport system substrate-binding protein